MSELFPNGSVGPLRLVSAWATESGLSLGQVAIDEKSNEITAIPALLKDIDIQDAIVTLDAAGCQRDIAETIVANKGDYVVALEGNQGTLNKDGIDYLEMQMGDDFKQAQARSHHQTEK